MAKARAPHVLPALLRLTWDLGDLPSAQHRAGLAGLVCFARWLAERKNLGGKVQEAIFRVTELTPGRATLTLNRAGLEVCYDALFGATWGETQEATPRKDRDGQRVEPLREEPVPVLDAKGREIEGKDGAVKTRKVYVYPQVVPEGAFLVAHEPATSDGCWIKLWREVVWGILRGVPATRAPFEDRAEGRTPRDVDAAWALLADADDPTVDLPSTYFLGAQARTAEAVPFCDRARRRFLLHFWPYVAGLYVPQVTLSDGSLRGDGYVVAVPDVADLVAFAQALPRVLASRDPAPRYRHPREALVDLPPEAGFAFFGWMRKVVGAHMGERGGPLLGVDVFHVAKDGHNVRVQATARVAPEPSAVDAYLRWRGVFWDAAFRRQVMGNILRGRPPWWGFGRALACMPFKTQGFGASRFCRDAATLFTEMNHVTTHNPDEDRTVIPLVREIVRHYLTRRTTERVGLAWEVAKDADATRARWGDAKKKLAQKTFLAVRSARCARDFARLFTDTLASRGAWLDDDAYARLAARLLDPVRYEDVRSLVLLALAAENWMSSPRAANPEPAADASPVEPAADASPVEPAASEPAPTP